MYFHFTKKLLISPFPYLLNLVALHQSSVAQHRPKNNDDDDNDNADDGDGYGNVDGDDIYIMMKCLCVCVSRKIITSSWESPVTT